jgi:hypothetical protein
MRVSVKPCKQCCQMVYFQTKNPNVDTFWRALECKMLLHFMIIWNIVWPFCKFMAVWCTSWPFGIFFTILVRLDQEKSGNPACKLMSA